MTEFKCPHCDGPFEVAQHSSTVLCPYCNTTIQIKTGEILKESYIMRLQYTVDQAKEKMLSWALKQLGVPKALEDKAEIVESRLVFWPFWVVEIEAVADYTGVQKKPDFGTSSTTSTSNMTTVEEDGHIDIEEDIFVPAAANVPEHLARYIIPTKRKEFFDQEIVTETNGSLEPIVIEREKAVEFAKKQMTDLIHLETKKEVDNVTKMSTDMKETAVFLVHIPVWHIKYDYSIRKYDALVDGASGRIIYLEFPRKIAFRAMTMLSGLIHLVGGGGIGLLLVYLGYIAGDFIFPTIFGIIFGLGMLAFALRFFRTALSLKAGEEEAG